MTTQYQDQINEIAIFAKNGNYDLSNSEQFDKMMKDWMYKSASLYNNRDDIMTNSTNTEEKLYRFNGFGNYSSHGWDSGLTFSYYGEMDINPDSWNYEHPLPKKGEVNIIFSNSYGGSRSVDVAIFANSVDEAEKIANRWAFDNYPVEQYYS